MSAIGTDEELTARIAAYLTEQSGRTVRVGRIRRFPVGFSWLTYLVPVSGLDDDVGERELILRLGPDDGLFAPYSALPQVRAMQSLEGSGVPVPRAFWHSDDPAILGAPFLFSEKAEGEAVVPWVSPSEPPLEEGLRIRLAHQFIDSLAALHRVDWHGKPIAAMAGDVDEHNAALRSVQTWEALIRRWQMRPYPLADWGLRWLKTHCPRAPRVTIVHGDYRTGNFLQVDGRITAILDWELVHLGDPHEDLAWASMPMYKGGTPYIGRLAEPELVLRPLRRTAFGHRGVDGGGALLPGLLAAQAGRHAHGGGALLRGGPLQRPAHAGHGQPDRHLPAADGEDDRGPVHEQLLRPPDRRHVRHAAPGGADASGRRVCARPGVRRHQPAQHLQGARRLVGRVSAAADRGAAGGAGRGAGARGHVVGGGRPAGDAPGPAAAVVPVAELLQRRDDGNRAIGECWPGWTSVARPCPATRWPASSDCCARPWTPRCRSSSGIRLGHCLPRCPAAAKAEPARARPEGLARLAKGRGRFHARGLTPGAMAARSQLP
jgi:aminoglycoside phosphotransferase (APT) family kinase protein